MAMCYAKLHIYFQLAYLPTASIKLYLSFVISVLGYIAFHVKGNQCHLMSFIIALITVTHFET